MSTRRAFLKTSAVLPALAWARIVGAQKQVPMIGWLNSGSRKSSGHYIVAFREGMAALGWKDGSTYVLEERWADAQLDRLPILAAEIAAKKPALIATAPTATTRAAAKAAPNTPIVQVNGGDLAEAGLVASLARPGGMITGVTNASTHVNEKYLELLLNAVPKAKRIGFLLDPTAGAYAMIKDSLQRVISRYPIEASFAEAANPSQIEPAMSRLAKQGAQALVLMPSNFYQAERDRIVKLALAYRWPMMTGHDLYTSAGALLSYGADRAALVRRSAAYVDKILKGAKPGDLPIEQPTKFELVINRRTAKALGIAISQELLLRADKVIE